VPNETVRTHVVLRKDVVDSIDRLVGPRSRSKFIEEAAEEKLARVRIVDAAAKAAGSLEDVHIPAWETSEAAAAWVRASRLADSDRLDSLLKGSGRPIRRCDLVSDVYLPLNRPPR
jgi:hypothetical protein